MRLIRLTNSKDVTPGATTARAVLIAARLEDAFGEPVELVTRTPWPNERMPEMVSR